MPGKKYNEARKLVSSTTQYSVVDAVELAKKASYAKFDGSLEIAIKTFANPKYNDQMIRATTVLPHGTGKTVKIAAFVSDDQVKDALKAGAVVAGNDTLITDIEKGIMNFDVLITTPDMMRNLTKVAKALGPIGLMPSPKAGTVTQDVIAAIDEVKKGRVEFRLDKTGNIHASVGKMSFDNAKLAENVAHFIKSVEDAKPEGVKGKLIKKVVISGTMGVGVAVGA